MLVSQDEATYGCKPLEAGRPYGDLIRAIHSPAFGLQKDYKRRFKRRIWRENSLQLTGGRTWIRTTDLFLIREAL